MDNPPTNSISQPLTLFWQLTQVPKGMLSWDFGGREGREQDNVITTRGVEEKIWRYFCNFTLELVRARDGSNDWTPAANLGRFWHRQPWHCLSLSQSIDEHPSRRHRLCLNAKIFARQEDNFNISGAYREENDSLQNIGKRETGRAMQKSEEPQK